MIFLLSFFFVFNHCHEKLLYAPQINFEIATQKGTIKEHIINALDQENYNKYKDHLEFFMWTTLASCKNYMLVRYKDKQDNYGCISKYKIAYQQGFNLIEKNIFSVFQFESHDETAQLKTFVILNFSSNDSAHVNHLMDFLNLHRN